MGDSSWGFKAPLNPPQGGTLESEYTTSPIDKKTLALSESKNPPWGAGGLSPLGGRGAWLLSHHIYFPP